MTEVFGDSELIEMRDDERIDTSRLEPFLREHIFKSDEPLSFAQFGGGSANLTYFVRCGDDEYVVRRPPLGPIAASAHDMKREHRVLSRLWRGFPLAPRSYLYSDDESIIGAEFHVMERRHGFGIRTDLPDELRGDKDTCRRIGEMVIDTLATLHMVDPASVDLDTLGRPDGFAARQLDGWTKRWHAAKDTDIEDFDRLVAWLEPRLPEPRAVSLLHNDFKLDNMLLDRADPATPTAVLDWDMCTRGDPLMDLGQMLTYWAQADDDPRWHDRMGTPSWEPGFPSRDDIVERYAAATGIDVGEVRWYFAFGIFKLIVVLQQIYIRYLRGQTRDARFAHFGDRIRAMADKGVAVTEGRLA